MTTPPAPTFGPAVTRDGLVVGGSITPARLGLGRSGSGLPTGAALDFLAAHAQARDAVHAVLDRESLAGDLLPLGLEVVHVASAAGDRATYLRRPDLGRRLSREARDRLTARPRDPGDVGIVIGDGLSARAVAENAAALLGQLVPLLGAEGLSFGPLVIARQARVAIGDEIGALLEARLVLVLIGERPGLSAADSLGAYLTFDPRIGRTDAQRNCVSNIRAGGLPSDRAAATIAWLIRQAFRLQLTGVALKDESEAALLNRQPAAQISRTTCLPKFAPDSSPINAPGAAAKPSATDSR